MKKIELHLPSPRKQLIKIILLAVGVFLCSLVAYLDADTQVLRPTAILAAAFSLLMLIIEILFSIPTVISKCRKRKKGDAVCSEENH